MTINRIQLLAKVRDVTGIQLTLRLGEELQAVNFGDDCVIALIKTVTLVPMTRGYKVVEEGTRLVTFERDVEHPFSDVWNTDEIKAMNKVSPYQLDGFPSGLFPEEYQGKRQWEDDCFRPGNGTRLGQRDSADRVFQGYDYSRPAFYSTTTPKE